MLRLTRLSPQLSSQCYQVASECCNRAVETAEAAQHAGPESMLRGVNEPSAWSLVLELHICRACLFSASASQMVRA